MSSSYAQEEMITKFIFGILIIYKIILQNIMNIKQL